MNYNIFLILDLSNKPECRKNLAQFLIKEDMAKFFKQIGLENNSTETQSTISVEDENKNEKSANNNKKKKKNKKSKKSDNKMTEIDQIESPKSSISTVTTDENDELDQQKQEELSENSEINKNGDIGQLLKNDAKNGFKIVWPEQDEGIDFEQRLAKELSNIKSFEGQFLWVTFGNNNL